MNISHHGILQQVEKELQAARQQDGPALKSHIYAIKALCEVLLQEEGSPITTSPSPQYTKRTVLEAPPVTASKQQSTIVNEAQKIPTDDGANGSSLFDF
ncbi:hypothetical protein Q73_14185 [Bacillus coahuilensis m2-6]|uniref:YwdI family protein n=1 Tax=Bacillus coahuilensis TaxID=408580 RepID=UPI00018513C4|nr:YwdI family protein [Bacillus coahuilensis]KUP04983.1 hypothetical protein Q73_14185 [Bacillus coahuilensis m2-6]